MKILISAYTCETGRGSEGEIGWRLAHALAAKHEVTVLTRANLRDVHEESFKEHPKPKNLRFEYFDLPYIFRFYKKGKRGFLIYYYLWQIGIGLRARHLTRKKPVDVLHHLIGGMDWMPAGLSLCSGPLIWGPVGSENTHPLILCHQPLKTQIKDKVRTGMRWFMRTLDPFTRFTASRAKIIFSHTPDNLPERLAPIVRPLAQTGIFDHPNIAIPKVDLARGVRLRLIYVGDLKDFKGARMALDSALRVFELGYPADLTIVGDGPLRNEMKKIVDTHPNGKQVQFLGKISMKKLVHTLHDSDIMICPTFHHGLSTIVLQAMLTRLPIICADGDATGRAVGQLAGITVKLSNDVKPYQSLAKAIIDLAENEEKRQTLADQARKIALEHYNYGSLAEQISKTYQEFTKSNNTNA